MISLKKIALIGSLTLLTACGFHLRGSTGDVTLSFKTLSIIEANKAADNDIATRLSEIMRGQVVQVKAPAIAQVTLEISEITRSKVSSNKNASGRTIEYRLTNAATIQAFDAQKNQLIAPVNLTVARTLSAGDNYQTGIDLEEAKLYDEMDLELANLIQYRLRAIKTNATK